MVLQTRFLHFYLPFFLYFSNASRISSGNPSHSFDFIYSNFFTREFSGYPGDDTCVSLFPNLCKFVDELPKPEEIQVANGDLIKLGAYNIKHKFHRDLKLSRTYGFGRTRGSASVPGPTLAAIRNVPAKILWRNHLWDHQLEVPSHFLGKIMNGTIPLSIHLHGGETEPSSDGHPEAWITAMEDKGPKFVNKVNTYTNSQHPATLWYHDHTIHLTARNVYYGLAGFYIIRDPNGKEANFELPSSEFDYPLLLQNKQVEESGGLHESLNNTEVKLVESTGIMCVNGKAWPHMEIKKTMYRFRLLNGANLRFFNITFLLVDQNKKNTSETGLHWKIPEGRFLQFKVIASDGGYLNSPITTKSVPIGPAERYEIVIDFSEITENGGFQEILLLNTGDTPLNENGIPNDSNGGVFAKFFLRPNSKKLPSPNLPVVLNDLPRALELKADLRRVISLTEIQDGEDRGHFLGARRWTAKATEIVQEGSTEIWWLVNLTPQTHTVHLHNVKFRILGRQKLDYKGFLDKTCSFMENSLNTSCILEQGGSPISAVESGWKDTVFVFPYEVTMIVFSAMNQDGEKFPFNFSSFPGYVWHCHMLEHEDHDMMRPLRFASDLSRHEQVIYDTFLLNDQEPNLAVLDEKSNEEEIHFMGFEGHSNNV